MVFIKAKNVKLSSSFPACRGCSSGGIPTESIGIYSEDDWGILGFLIRLNSEKILKVFWQNNSE
jgi:hypothetical protein